MLTEKFESIIKGVKTIGIYHAGAKEAAQAIYAWLREGVVWEGEGCLLHLYHHGTVISVPGVGRLEIDDRGPRERIGPHGRRVRVFVWLPKGEQADFSEQLTVGNSLQTESKPPEVDKERGE